ncbi:ribonuclease HII [Candidatus Uhrbacteria bacterium CG10_big_fil_rev_8_21_14_0_10_48_11]|uniref:Ribonuclease HII n=1 Tax=Candidatus Uhrbacteria bacterium CG10_big_fil_rev_8_21_14_0_10_48_11 TaxID=1975037 RepID=A0A2M8LEQ8_9BACT|nr:MAG: ribonuclease HII [Candidatus Uhrbacteria bacterium CG10_big_fil_rev_8_21_14_0_10_48_11]
MASFRPVESYRRGQGYQIIAGIDEVGRGALAGPLVAAALVLRPHVKLGGLKDSKALRSQQREHYASRIIAGAVAYAFGVVSAREIDRLGIAKANNVAFIRALDGLRVRPDYVLADYFSLAGYRCPIEGVKGGDTDVRTIAAASVIAKVHRDGMMRKLHCRYPAYGFAKHVGYGTVLHRRAIRRYGLSPIHRCSFRLA